ncbi:MAG: hypothetical protein JWM09_622 [Francisellaceae bacterium]|nr:hypothetical protein [Francisellaceae bacterium]
MSNVQVLINLIKNNQEDGAIMLMNQNPELHKMDLINRLEPIRIMDLAIERGCLKIIVYLIAIGVVIEKNHFKNFFYEDNIGIGFNHDKGFSREYLKQKEIFNVLYRQFSIELIKQYCHSPSLIDIEFQDDKAWLSLLQPMNQCINTPEENTSILSTKDNDFFELKNLLVTYISKLDENKAIHLMNKFPMLQHSSLINEGYSKCAIDLTIESGSLKILSYLIANGIKVNPENLQRSRALRTIIIEKRNVLESLLIRVAISDLLKFQLIFELMRKYASMPFVLTSEFGEEKADWIISKPILNPFTSFKLKRKSLDFAKSYDDKISPPLKMSQY